MKHTYPLRTLLLILLVFAFGFSQATITVDSVHITLSTCPNNGTAKVYARSTRNTAAFLFNITSGPVTYPLQNDSTFYSLYPGAYIGWVHDVNSFDSTRFTFTITGNYVYSVINARVTSPICYTGNAGQLVGQLTPATGVAPFNWQRLLPDSTPPQASDTFSNLAPGDYTIRVKDGCGIGRTANAHIDSPSLEFSFPFMEIYWINCNTAKLDLTVVIDTDRAYLPINLTTTTSQGTTSKYRHLVPISTGINPGRYDILDTIQNAHYGDYHRVCITDTCQVTLCYKADSIEHFRFKMDWIPTVANCINGYAGNIRMDPGPYDISVSTASPITAVLTDTLHHVTVDSFTYAISYYNGNFCNNCLQVPPQPDTLPYLLTVTDGCGNVFKKNITWPHGTPVQPRVFPLVNGQYPGCLDSTWIGELSVQGFSSTATLVINSGPPLSQSSTPHFAYRDTLIYPITYNNIGNGITINNMPAGTYNYTVSDSCGSSVTLTTYFPPAREIIAFKPGVIYGCNHLSTIRITYPFHEWPGYTAILTNLSTHATIPGFTVDSSFAYSSLPPGKYHLTLQYKEYVYGVPLIGNANCWFYSDTIVIPVFNDSTFKAVAVAQCNGVIHVSVVVDSANGIPPFRYNIVSGPQTFIFQNSPDFVVDSFGTYLASVLDSCGNIDARYVTIDTGRIDPVARTGGNCFGGVVKLYDVSSPYFRYVWQKPNHTFYTGDTLVINSFSQSDTGLYNVIKIVNINGCLDSSYGSYYLALKDTFQQSVFTCPGVPYHVGNTTYNTPGVYYDTLTSNGGCDSIIITNFAHYNVTPASITPSQILACRNGPITLTANAGGNGYVWSNTAMIASIIVNPGVQTTYVVTVTDAHTCTSSASVTVNPSVAPARTLIARAFCYGTSVQVGNHTYTQTGNYIDTLTGHLGCDSIVTTNLTVYPLPVAAISISDSTPCRTGSVTLTATGGLFYVWSSGQSVAAITVNPTNTTQYTVTITGNQNCTASASATVNPSVGPAATLITRAFCFGSSVQVGGHTYTQTGNYIDTLTGHLGCDSIVTTNLTVYPLPVAGLSISDSTPCRTGSVTLTASGGTAYVWSSGQSVAAITVSPTNTTQYTVTITGNQNCTATAQQTVYPASTDSSMHISPGTGGICPGDSVQLCAPNNLNNYQWNNGAQTQCITVNKPGTFTVTATDNNNCHLVSDTVQIHVYATTQPVIILVRGTLQSSTTYAAYQWYLNGNAIQGATGQSLLQLSGGSYTLQVTDSNGCITNSAAYVITGISNITNNTPALSVYPNPNNTNQWQVIIGDELVNAQCQVFDVDGKTVYTTQLTGTNNIINTHLAAGTYIMRISTGQNIYNIRLVQF